MTAGRSPIRERETARWVKVCRRNDRGAWHERPCLIHFDGAAWTEVLITGSSTELDRVAGAQGHLFAAGIPALLVTYP